METFEIYTLGSGYYLEKIFNAINLILDPSNNFISVMKLSSLAAVVILTIRAGLNNDFKTAAKWFFGVTILAGLFLTSKADIQIIDTLPDSYGRLSAARSVKSVPWGLAVIGSTTSRVGNSIAQKFDQALAGVFNNSAYQETGLLFGSKIVEDTSKMRIEDASIKQLMLSFYKKCIVPDISMGYKRANGYSLKDLSNSDNILEFLKDHSSKARIIYVPHQISGNTTKGGNSGGYQSCQKTAEYLYTSLEKASEIRMPILAKQFGRFFSQSQAGNSSEASLVFESVLQGSYGIFIKQNSKTAKDILLQNIAINSVGDAAGSNAFGKVATESMTKLAYNSVGQMAQKFIPILRAVLECLFYGVFPLILILMVTPIGLEVLKNYAFGFIYLQLWQPMYAILFCIASGWGKLYASNITDITFASHSQIMSINEEISSIAGYMLTLVPILSLFITKGMIANMGNLTSSIIYIPQSTAVQNAESAIKGNYQIGTTAIDTHSSNQSHSNKHDDNYSWMSGMKSFSMPSGAQEKIYADGRSGLDSSGAVSNLAGLAKADMSRAMGMRYDQSISDNVNKAERHASSAVESASSGYAKLLGFDQHYSKNSQTYDNWNKGLTLDQRSSVDEARSFVDKVAKANNISKQDALQLAVKANAGIGLKGPVNLGVGVEISGSTTANKMQSYNKMLASSKDEKFAKALSAIESLSNSNSYQEGVNSSNSMIDSVKSDFNRSKSASMEMAKSVDKVHSLQTAKSNFEQNSSSFSQDLTNQFAEENIQRFGASGFENIIRTDPKQTEQLLQEFAGRQISRESVGLNNEITQEKNNFQNNVNDLKTKHLQNTNEVELTSYGRERKIEKSGSQDLRHEVKGKLSANPKRDIAENLNKNQLELKNKASVIDNKADDIVKKVNKKSNKSATRFLLSSLNPLKKDD